MQYDCHQPDVTHTLKVDQQAELELVKSEGTRI